MKFLERNSDLYSRADVQRFGLNLYITKYNDNSNEDQDWSIWFAQNSIVDLQLKSELYGDIRSSCSDQAFVTMDNSNNAFFEDIGINIKDANKLIGCQLEVRGDYLKEDWFFAYDWGDKLTFNGYPLFAGQITNIIINDQLSRVQLEIWDNSISLKKLPVFQENDNTVPYTAANSWLITDVKNVWGAIRYALKYGTKNYGYSSEKRYRTSRVTAFDGANRKITVVDWSDFSAGQQVKLGYTTKYANYEENFIDYVDLNTNTLYLKYPLKSAHSVGEWLCFEHHMLWIDTSIMPYTYYNTNAKIWTAVSAGATSIVLSSLLDTIMFYNLYGSNLKIKIGTNEEHLTVDSVSWNDVYTKQYFSQTHSAWEYLDDCKLYIDKGHDLSNDPNNPAYIWFETGENVWDTIVSLANSDAWKISCSHDVTNLYIQNIFGNLTSQDISAYVIKFDSLQTLMATRWVVAQYTDQFLYVPPASSYYAQYNSLLKDGLEIRTNYDEYINAVKINLVIRKIDTDIRSIWSLYAPLWVPAGWTQDFDIECNDPIYSYVWPLTSITDYQANTAPDGTGWDATANISFTVIQPTSAKRIKIRAANSSGWQIYLTKFELKWRAYTENKDSRHFAFYKDAASVNQNGLYQHEINNKYINNLPYAQALAQNIVNLYKKNYERRRVNMILNIALEPGDTIRIYSDRLQNDFTGTIIRMSQTFSQEWYFTELDIGLMNSATYVAGALVPPMSYISDTFLDNTKTDTTNTTSIIDTTLWQIRSWLNFIGIVEDTSNAQYYIGDSFVDQTKIDTGASNHQYSNDGILVAWLSGSILEDISTPQVIVDDFVDKTKTDTAGSDTWYSNDWIYISNLSGSILEDISAPQVIVDDFIDTWLINNSYHTNVLQSSKLELPWRWITPIAFYNTSGQFSAGPSYLSWGSYAFNPWTDKRLIDWQINGSIVMNNSLMSINFWYYTLSLASCYAFHKQTYQSTPSASYSGIGMNISWPNIILYCHNASATPVYKYYSSIISAGANQMITVTFNAGTLNLYINWVLKTPSTTYWTIPATIWSTANPFVLGSAIVNGSYTSSSNNGEVIDEFSIWNWKELSAWDMSFLMNYGSGWQAANLLQQPTYYFNFNDLWSFGYLSYGKYTDYFVTGKSTETINFNTTGMIWFKIDLVKNLNSQTITLDYSIDNRSSFTTWFTEWVQQTVSSNQLIVRFNLSTSSTQSTPQIWKYTLTIYK